MSITLAFALALVSQPTDADLVQMLRVVDERSTAPGDYRSLAYLEQKAPGKEDVAREVLIYRRDSDEKLMLLFTRPKAEAGKGYLRSDGNWLMYDPTIGKWERRSVRERVGGSDSRLSDFGKLELAKEYTPKHVGDERLGQVAVTHLALTAKDGADVAFPSCDIYVDKLTGNILKRQDKAASGKLIRTTYYPKWSKLYSETKKADLYIAVEIRIFDEVEKGISTMTVIKETDLRPLSANIFTKAWLESKTR